MSRLRLVALVIVLIVLVVVAWLKFPRGESSED
jgi:hypothetical protein